MTGRPVVRIAVVVPTRDRPAMLERCLTSIEASVAAGDEIIVADSASADPAPIRAQAELRRARYLRIDEPGASRARNAGWRAAGAELVAFVDDDVTVAPEWAAGLKASAEAHPEAAFFTGRIGVAPDQAGAERPVAVKDDPVGAPIDLTTTGVLGHSANLAVRRAVLAEVGGFDESLGAGGRFRASEDGDLWDRVLLAGHQGRYEPAMAAWHDQWRTKRELLSLEWAYGLGFGVRLVKLARADRRRAKIVAHDYLWSAGVATLPAALRRGYKFGVASVLIRLGGVVAGVGGSAWRPVYDGHLRVGR